MTKRKPFTQSNIEERESWPESQAALLGPEAYEECGVLDPTQRLALVQLARVTPEQAKPFINTVTCLINGYCHRKRVHAQESPAAVAASMRRLIDAVEQLMAEANTLPIWVVKEVFDAIKIAPTADGFRAAKEKVRQWELKIDSHRPPKITYSLIMHAWALQKLAGDYSKKYLASNWKAMKRWLEEALIASGEQPPIKNGKTAYFDELMLPRAADGSVDLLGAPRQLAPASPDKGT
jgi:hypothetical protein